MIVNKINLNELRALIERNELSIFRDEAYKAYGKTKEESSFNLIKIIERVNAIYQAIGAETRYFWCHMDASGTYNFADNLLAYHRKEISEGALEVQPISISQVKIGSSFLSARFWEYKRPTLTVNKTSGVVLVNLSLPIKIIYEIAPDGNFTEDSCIYFQSIDNHNYIDYITLELLKNIKKRVDAVEVGQVRMFPEIGTAIQELQQRIQDSDIAEVGIYKSWRK